MNEAQNYELTAEQLELGLKLASIFMPLAKKQMDAHYNRPSSGAMADDARFVHYTSAEAALSIINSKRMWMRNARSMADYSEVQHGFSILTKFFSDEAKKAAFTNALDECFPGLAAAAFGLFDQHWTAVRFHTYITSISEHMAAEDTHGRLSMWRAFGGSAPRVAIVFNLPRASAAATALNLMFSPVAYLTEEEAHATIHQVIANIRANAVFLSSCDRQLILYYVFTTLLAAVTCLKHEGFREEREWRAIYSPRLLPPSALMQCSTQIIAGVPQVVYSIPFDKTASPALARLDFSRIFDRLIIGPSPYAFPMSEAFTAALARAGFSPEEARGKVFVSGIPIRA
jgi:hypothetical protein